MTEDELKALKARAYDIIVEMATLRAEMQQAEQQLAQLREKIAQSTDPARS